MSTFVFAYFVILAVIFAKKQRTLLSPEVLFLIGWIIPYGVMISDIVIYKIEISLGTQILVMAFAASFLAGCSCARRFGPELKAPAVSELFIPPVVATILVLLSAIDWGFLLKDILSRHGSSVLELDPSALATTRNAAWAAFYSGDVKSNALRSPFVAAMQLMAMASPIFLASGYKKLSAYSAICVFGAAAESILGAGRFNIVFIALVIYLEVVMLSAMNPTKGIKRLFTIAKWSPVVLALPMLFVIFITFALLRNPIVLMHPDAFLIGAADFSPWIQNAAVRLNAPELYMFAISSTYFSYPPVALEASLKFAHIDDWYALGTYNLPIISQISSALGFGNPFVGYRVQIANAMNGYLLPVNAWSSGLRDYIIDFGRIGAIIAVFPVGYLITYGTMKFSNSARIDVRTAISIFLVMSLIFGILSPTIQRVVQNPLILLALIYGVDRFWKGAGWYPYHSQEVIPAGEIQQA